VELQRTLLAAAERIVEGIEDVDLRHGPPPGAATRPAAGRSPVPVNSINTLKYFI
jgi:hypothetical protein